MAAQLKRSRRVCMTRVAKVKKQAKMREGLRQALEKLIMRAEMKLREPGEGRRGNY